MYKYECKFVSARQRESLQIKARSKARKLAVLFVVVAPTYPALQLHVYPDAGAAMSEHVAPVPQLTDPAHPSTSTQVAATLNAVVPLYPVLQMHS